MKHKRCPLDCPERRPKPNQELEPAVIVQGKNEVIKSRPPRTNSGVTKKNVLQLEEYVHVVQVPLSTAPTERDNSHWDSVEWEGLGWDAEHVCLKETEAWMDLKSSSHWEESKSQVLACEDTKPMDDLTKYEEEEIIDSWLNDEGFDNSTQDYESAERNEGREGNASEAGSCINHVIETLPKILITRDMLERWSSELYFNSLICGYFVRVKIGEYMDNPIYRIAYIQEAHDGFVNNNSTPAKGLSLRMGDNMQMFPIAAVSNHPPTDSELRTWQTEMEKAKIVFDPREVQKKEEMRRLLTMRYPDFPSGLQDMEPMINEPMINEPLWNC